MLELRTGKMWLHTRPVGTRRCIIMYTELNLDHNAGGGPFCIFLFPDNPKFSVKLPGLRPIGKWHAAFLGNTFSKQCIIKNQWRQKRQFESDICIRMPRQGKCYHGANGILLYLLCFCDFTKKKLTSQVLQHCQLGYLVRHGMQGESVAMMTGQVQKG